MKIHDQHAELPPLQVPLRRASGAARYVVAAFLLPTLSTSRTRVIQVQRHKRVGPHPTTSRTGPGRYQPLNAVCQLQLMHHHPVALAMVIQVVVMNSTAFFFAVRGPVHRSSMSCRVRCRARKTWSSMRMMSTHLASRKVLRPRERWRRVAKAVCSPPAPARPAPARGLGVGHARGTQQ